MRDSVMLKPKEKLEFRHLAQDMRAESPLPQI